MELHLAIKQTSKSTTKIQKKDEFQSPYDE